MTIRATPVLPLKLAILTTDPGVRHTGYEFQKLDPERLRHIGSQTVQAAGTKHAVELFTLDTPTDEAEAAEKVYLAAQTAAINFAAYYKTIDLPLSGVHTAGERKLSATLTVLEDSTIFVAVPKNSFSTYIETQHHLNGNSAATFTPGGDPKLTGAITIVESADTYTSGVATEGCQSAIRAELSPANHLEMNDPGLTRLFMQEAVCMSIGEAFGMVKLGYDYQAYVQHMKHVPLFRFRDGKYIAGFIFPQAAYQQIVRGEPVTKAEGVQAAR